MIVDRRTWYSAMGDFEEEFFSNVKEKGQISAHVRYWGHIAVLLLSYVFNSFLWSFIMFGNYFTTMFRTVMREKLSTILKISGLAFGIATGIIAFLYIQNEFNYDSQHENKDRIYKVVRDTKSNEYMGNTKRAITAVPLAPALMEDFPEIEAATRFNNRGDILVKYNDISFMESEGVYADEYLFEIFSFPLISGDKNNLLNEPYSVVITEETSQKYFGGLNPLGEVLNFNNRVDLTVKGVIENIPENSHVKGDFFISIETLRSLGDPLDNWGSNNYHTFILLREDSDHRELEQKYPSFLTSRLENSRWWSGEEDLATYYHQKLTDIHLKADTVFNFRPVSDIKYIYIFSISAIFILLIACVNYMNLSTAQSLRRAKEVGLRKVIGAQRSQLIKQFMGESLFVTVISLLLAVVITLSVLPVFNNLVEKNISFNPMDNFTLLLILAALWGVVGLMSGSYPAFVISNFKPVRSIKGLFGAHSKGRGFRNILVVSQFSISVFLIISTFVISGQLDYIRNKNLGFTKDQIVTVTLDDREIRTQHKVVKEELLKQPGITAVTFSSSLPMNVTTRRGLIYEGFNLNENEPLNAYFANVDYDFIDLFELEIVDGRKFTSDLDNTSYRYIANETAAKQFGWDNPVGELVGHTRNLGSVIGIVKDFHYTNMYLPMEPTMFFLSPEASNVFNIMSVKIDGNNVQASLKGIEEVWDNFSSGYPFDYTFMDDRYDAMYKSEIVLGKAFKYITTLAILIACLGLFGLSSFMAERRSKEIGIRKVLGAPLSGLLVLLSKDFLSLVIIANVIALPLGYLAMNRWLEDFAFRVGIGFEMFFAAAILSVGIALLTVLYQSLKAAFANPVDTLKYE